MYSIGSRSNRLHGNFQFQRVVFGLTFLLSFCLYCAKAETSTSTSLIEDLITQLYENLNTAENDLKNPNLWPRDYAEEFNKNEPVAHDYIVIGAGSAGSVVASRLSEDPNVSVLVMEAGGDPPLLSEVHSLSLLLANTSYTWNDYSEPNPTSCKAMKNERCYWLRGKMIGGTGGINGANFLPGTPEDYNEWHQQGNTGWAWNDVYPFFTKATEDLGSETKPYGSLILNHFVRLSDFEDFKDFMTNATMEMEQHLAVKSLGFREDIPATIDRGKRMSTGKTYLGKVARFRRNLHVLKRAVVTKIIISQRKKAIGIEFHLDNVGVFRLQAKKEIILSAGTFNSPKILMLSGIGPCRHLKQHNIACVQNLPVGRNFQDHGMMPLPLRFTRNTPPIQQTDPNQDMFDYLMYQKGPLATSPNLVGFINTLASQHINKSDILVTSSITQPKRNANMFETLQFKDEFTSHYLQQAENQTFLELVGLLIKPKSRGFIQLKSSDPFEGPLIYNRQATVQEDRNQLLRFVRLIQDLLKTPTFQYYGLEMVRLPLAECDKAFAYDSNDYWYCYIKYFYISSWHAVGTCHMGPASDPSAVVDSQLRVHGIKGLRVIDASIMPNITSGNTNGPTIMIAEKGSHMIKTERLNAL